MNLGPTYKISVTDLNGVKSPRTATQLSQSAYTPLALPFAFFGYTSIVYYVFDIYVFDLLTQYILLV